MSKFLNVAVAAATLVIFAVWQIYFVFGAVYPVLPLPKHSDMFFALCAILTYCGLATLFAMNWPQKSKRRFAIS